GRSARIGRPSGPLCPHGALAAPRKFVRSCADAEQQSDSGNGDEHEFPPAARHCGGKSRLSNANQGDTDNTNAGDSNARSEFARHFGRHCAGTLRLETRLGNPPLAERRIFGAAGTVFAYRECSVSERRERILIQ
ncbi:MAG: hypothetical protein WCA01_08120, partial [Burkholderiales bacterium]